VEKANIEIFVITESNRAIESFEIRSCPVCKSAVSPATFKMCSCVQSEQTAEKKT